MESRASCRRRGFAGVLLVVLVAVVIIAILYFGKWGKSKTYIETTIGAKNRAEDVTGSVNLSAVYKSLQIYALGNEGKFPETPEELSIEANLPRGYVWLPSKPAQESLTVYVAAQDQSMPATNILMYESVLGSDGMCMVLRLGGAVEKLTLEQVRAAVAETRKHIEKRRG